MAVGKMEPGLDGQMREWWHWWVANEYNGGG